MITKTIHYCWFGRGELPEKAKQCIESWKKFCPDYEIKEWNEDNFDMNSCAYVKEAYEAKKWAFVSDYARFEILYKYGGLYFDTDVELVKSFDDIVSKGTFMGLQPGKKTVHGMEYEVNPGLGLGSEPGVEVFKEIIEFYHQLHFVTGNGGQNIKTIVDYTTEILKKHGMVKLHVFDKDWPELPFAHREHIGCTVDYISGRNRYMGYLISLGIYSFKGVKVGLDCANGSSWNIAKSVFDALGADTYVINNKPNGLNINNNAGSTHIEGLQKFVVENHLDVGFAYDGDADRCLCVDEKGNVITGDHILYIYGCYMKERGKLLNNTVVTTVMSNFGLYKAFDEQGIGYAKTAVGDKYVYEYMAKNGCRVGGEQSGHIIFSKYASTGDGILTSLKMKEVMLAKKKPMSELAAPLKIYPQVLENVRVTDKKAAQNDPVVQEAVSKVDEALGDTGRILVRESGTEPVVRVMVEAPDHDTCQKYVDEVVNVICEKGYKA